jgi:hypothetical protein
MPGMALRLAITCPAGPRPVDLNACRSPGSSATPTHFVHTSTCTPSASTTRKDSVRHDGHRSDRAGWSLAAADARRSSSARGVGRSAASASPGIQSKPHAGQRQSCRTTTLHFGHVHTE